MTEMDRQEINYCIIDLARGNRLALDNLSRLVSGRMLSVAMSVVNNRNLAEDIVQDSFVKILNNAGKFRADTNGYAWICKIVQNVALNTLRHEKRFAADDLDGCFDLAAPDNVAEKSTASVILKQAMSQLSPLEQKVIYQKYFMDFTVRDIAKSINKPRSTVQRLVDSAESKMRTFLKG